MYIEGRGISAKNYSREERGQSETREHLKSLEQKMLSNKYWLAFFYKTKNKQHLFNLFVTYLPDDDFVNSRLLPILVNYEKEIFEISNKPLFINNPFLTVAPKIV